MRWVMGSKPDGSDSIAKVVKPREHWPDMRVIILVVSFILIHEGKVQYSVKSITFNYIYLICVGLFFSSGVGCNNSLLFATSTLYSLAFDLEVI